MGNHQSEAAPVIDVNEINKLQTHYSPKEIWELKTKFEKKFPRRYMSRDEFISEYSLETKSQCKDGGRIAAQRMFKTIDINKNGKIEFREFVYALSLVTRGTIEEKLQWVFEVYDANGDGKLDINEVAVIVRSMQAVRGSPAKDMSNKQIYAMFRQIDCASKSEITVEEFIKGAQSNENFLILISDYFK